MATSPEILRPRPQPWLKPASVAAAVLAALVVAGGLATRLAAHQKLEALADAEATPTVRVVAPEAAGGGQPLVLPGRVEAYYDAQIHARVSGYLRRWYRDIGERVRAGEVLADIDTPELDQQLAQARAGLAVAQANRRLAQTTAARWAGLLTQDAVSRQEAEEKAGDLDAKTAQVNAAAADVRRLEALEAFKRITAPFAGVVTGRSTDIGALISAGTPGGTGLFTVADVHRLRIYVRAPQSYAADIHPGSAASLTVPEHPGRVFIATLTANAGAVSDQSGTLLVELQIDNADGALLPGDYAQVRFDLPSPAGAVSLPASALMFRRQGMAVATVGPDSRVVMKPVTVAQDQGATVRIASGLGTGDRVIDNPPDSVVDGEAVRVAAVRRGG